jgi:catechol 2,3-dioxygenase-like lactoylglutathione lyase family enzyme
LNAETTRSLTDYLIPQFIRGRPSIAGGAAKVGANATSLRRRNAVPRLRHVAMTVPHVDLAKTAQFYENVFEMTRVRELDIAVLLTDGVVSLAIISDKSPLNAGHCGLHHIGFIVDDVNASTQLIESHGGRAGDDAYLAKMATSAAHVPKGEDLVEHKFFDPNGTVFDVVKPAYARNQWKVSA